MNGTTTHIHLFHFLHIYCSLLLLLFWAQNSDTDGISQSDLRLYFFHFWSKIWEMTLNVCNRQSQLIKVSKLKSCKDETLTLHWKCFFSPTDSKRGVYSVTLQSKCAYMLKTYYNVNITSGSIDISRNTSTGDFRKQNMNSLKYAYNVGKCKW